MMALLNIIIGLIIELLGLYGLLYNIIKGDYIFASSCVIIIALGIVLLYTEFHPVIM
jgi:hypothetical protein